MTYTPTGIDEIFDKNLFMLIPYYIFTHEKRFEEYNTNEEKLKELQTEYAGIVDRLKDLKESGQLTEYDHRMVLDMSGQVLEYIAAKYDNIREGVGEFMRGGIIETEASRIFDAGVRKGEARGKALGETRGIAIGETRGIAIGEARGETRKSERTAIRLYARGDAPADIADILEVDIRQVQQWILPNKG